MHPKSRKLLEDMRSAASEIVGLAEGRTLHQYNASIQLRWCIERGFEIVGEALSQLMKLEPETALRIIDHRKIISFGNVLIHGYSKVNSELTWDIVQRSLPILRRELDDLLK